MSDLLDGLDKKLSSFKSIDQVLLSGNRNLVTFVNPFSYPILDKSTGVVNQFDYIYADGALLVKLHNIFNGNKITRVSFDFSSIAHDVFNFASRNNKSVFFIGGSPEEINLSVENIKSIYGNLNIIGFHHGYLDNISSDILLKRLFLLKPSIIVVGMGTPLQEEFSIEIKNSGVDFDHIFTCGGFITQSASKPDYYLPIVKKLGLRWLQRFLQSPHVRRRVLINYPAFVFNYLLSQLKFKIKK